MNGLIHIPLGPIQECFLLADPLQPRIFEVPQLAGALDRPGRTARVMVQLHPLAIGSKPGSCPFLLRIPRRAGSLRVPLQLKGARVHRLVCMPPSYALSLDWWLHETQKYNFGRQGNRQKKRIRPLNAQGWKSWGVEWK